MKPEPAEPIRYARLLVEYDGGPFRGWSRQPGHRTIEGELLAAAARVNTGITRMRVGGRTDAGVHAAAQVISLHYTGPIEPERLGLALNTRLPDEIAVLQSTACDPSFDARGDASSRAYEYRLLVRREPSPLRAGRVLHHPRPLDRDLLDAAAAMVSGKHDFTAFTPSQTSHVFFHRTVLASRWVERGDELVYEVRANAFLRHMVRVMVGTMLAIGRGDLSLAQLEALLAGGSRSDAHNTAAPQGLCLVDIDYDGPPAMPRELLRAEVEPAGDPLSTPG